MSMFDKLRNKNIVLPTCPIPLRPAVLLSPNTPTPMHQVVPRTILGRKWWDATRKAAYELTNHCCIACGVHRTQARFRDWVEGHELYRVDYVRGIWEYVETVALCHCCHNYIHDGRLRTLLDQGKITHAKYAAIIQHGDLVLQQAGLSRPSHAERCAEINNGVIAPWEKWRLLLFGKKYKPHFKSYEDWEAHWKADWEE